MSRLEEIKEAVKMIDLAYEIDYVMTTEDSDKMKVIKRDDVRWLISRVEELEEENQQLANWIKRNAEINLRYKQALEFYADKDNWEVHQLTDGVLDGENIVPPEYEPAWAYADEGEVARKALKGDTND